MTSTMIGSIARYRSNLLNRRQYSIVIGNAALLNSFLQKQHRVLQSLRLPSILGVVPSLLIPNVPSPVFVAPSLNLLTRSLPSPSSTLSIALPQSNISSLAVAPKLKTEMMDSYYRLVSRRVVAELESTTYHRQLLPRVSEFKKLFLKKILVKSVPKIRRKWFASKNIVFERSNPVTGSKSSKKMSYQMFLKDYTGADYKAINGALRSGKASPLSHVQTQIKGVVSSLSCGHLTPFCESAEGKNKVLYRGAKNLTGKYRPVLGGTYSDKGFLSTSIDRHTAYSFALNENKPENKPYLFTIRKHITGIDISKFSRNKHELEVLFLPNTLFRVVSVKEGKGITEVELDEMV